MFEAKDQYGDRIYVVDFPEGMSIPFKLLSYKDFQSCRTSLGLGSIPPNEVYAFIYRKCVLDAFFLEKIDDLRAGIPDTIAKLIFFLSGPADVNTLNQLLNIERHAARTVESQMRITICRVFTGYTMSMLDELSFPEILKLFTEAESVLLDSKVLEKPFQIMDSEGQKTTPFSIATAEKEAREFNKS